MRQPPRAIAITVKLIRKTIESLIKQDNG